MSKTACILNESGLLSDITEVTVVNAADHEAGHETRDANNNMVGPLDDKRKAIVDYDDSSDSEVAVAPMPPRKKAKKAKSF